MFSGLKLWPPRLLAKGEPSKNLGFVPTTAMAARIVGQTVVQPSADAVADPQRTGTSFDTPSPIDLDLSPPGELEPADQTDIDEALGLSRKADRFVPDRPSTTLTDKRGKSIRARIINVSESGVAIEADFSVIPADSIALVGQKPVILGRSIRRGQVFLFEKHLDPARCNRQIVL